MTQSMTKLARAGRAGAFTAMLAIIGMTAAMASVKTARAWDQQASEAGSEYEINRLVAGQSVVARRSGPYASARRERRVEVTPATERTSRTSDRSSDGARPTFGPSRPELIEAR